MKAHRIGLVVLVLVLGLSAIPAMAQGPFPPPPGYPPQVEGWHSTYSGAIGGYQYMRTYMQNWQAVSEITDYGWQVLGHRYVSNGAGMSGLYITAARSATYTTPMLGFGLVPQGYYIGAQGITNYYHGYGLGTMNNELH